MGADGSGMEIGACVVVFALAGGSSVMAEIEGDAGAGVVGGEEVAPFGAHPASRREAIRSSANERRQSGRKRLFVEMSLVSSIVRFSSQERKWPLWKP